MYKDPVVEEIHVVRERMLAENGDDLDRLMDQLQVKEKEDEDKVVSSKDLNRSSTVVAGEASPE